MSEPRPRAEPPRQTNPDVVRPHRVGPPSKHQLAFMIWLAVFPTLTVLNLTIGPWLSGSGPVLRTFVLATIAVPIVIYGVMPRLHRIRADLLGRRAA
jgi:antibiotic biosynthesis monooxygenase (ABM) superfamily enzyme